MIVVNILFKFTRLKLIYGYPLMADFFSETGLITETDTKISYPTETTTVPKDPEQKGTKTLTHSQLRFHFY